MKFLNTKGKLDILEAEEFKTFNAVMYDEMFDLPATQLQNIVQNICDKAIESIEDEKEPLLISITMQNIEDSDIKYYANQLFLYFMKGFTTTVKKFEEDLWQPRYMIVNSLNMTMQAQNRILNYQSRIQILNIEFRNNNNEKVYEMFTEEGEKK